MEVNLAHNACSLVHSRSWQIHLVTASPLSGGVRDRIKPQEGICLLQGFIRPWPDMRSMGPLFIYKSCGNCCVDFHFPGIFPHSHYMCFPRLTTHSNLQTFKFQHLVRPWFRYRISTMTQALIQHIRQIQGAGRLRGTSSQHLCRRHNSWPDGTHSHVLDA